MLTVVWMLARLREGRGAVSSYLCLGATLVVVLQLHQGFASLTMLIGALALAWGARFTPLITTGAALVALAFLAVTRLYSADLVPTVPNFGELGSYRKGVAVSRAAYQVDLDSSSPVAFLMTFPPVLFLYLFAPLPWQITGLKDFYALVESLLRMALFAGAGVNLLRSQPERRPKLLLLAVMLMALESIWSVGSANWGQAIRHRVIAFGFLVILGLDSWGQTPFGTDVR
jgi:hypothetical protein